MTKVSQTLTRPEASIRRQWILDNLGHREQQSGHFEVVAYPHDSNRVTLNVYFHHVADRTFYLLRWPT